MVGGCSCWRRSPKPTRPPGTGCAPRWGGLGLAARRRAHLQRTACGARAWRRGRVAADNGSSLMNLPTNARQSDDRSWPAQPADDAALPWLRPSPRLLTARRIELTVVAVPLVIVGGLAGLAASPLAVSAIATSIPAARPASPPL